MRSNSSFAPQDTPDPRGADGTFDSRASAPPATAPRPEWQSAPVEPLPAAPAPRRTTSSYWPTLAALALLAALLALLVVLILARSDLVGATSDLRLNPQNLSLHELALLILTAAIPLACAILSYMFAAQAVRLFRIALYLRRVHAYTGRQLRARASLYRRGIVPQVEPTGRSDQAHREALPVQRMLAAGGPILLSGEAGSGKTTAMLSLAYDLTRPRALLPTFLGRRRLPVLVSLSGFAADVYGGRAPTPARARSTPQLAYVQAQVARFGSAGLAARLPRRLRAGRALLLFDSLNDVALGMQGRILHDLAELVVHEPSHSSVSLILTHTGTLASPAAEMVRAGGGASRWEHWQMAPLGEEDVLRVAKSALPSGGPRRLAGQSGRTKQLRDELQVHRLDRALRLPGLLLDYTAVRPREQPLAYGRAALIERALDAACASVATSALPAEQLRDTLSALASSLAHVDVRAVPIAPRKSMGDTLCDWLTQHRPYSPLFAAKSGPLGLAPDVAQKCCDAAIRVGLLSITSDDSGFGFSQSLMEAACAARWLRIADDGASPLDPGLLRPRWVLPVILWTATTPDPGTVTRRLLPLASARPDAHNTLALATNPSQPRPTLASAASLALGGLTAAVAPAVSSFQGEGGDHSMQVARYERRLREVLDGVLEVLVHDPDPTGLARAVQAVESEIGDELAADLAYLASYSELSRLARAQMVTILGLLASPLARTALVAHLADRDPTLRSAVDRGFALAGTTGVSVLQQQLTSGDEWTRARARQALDGISARLQADSQAAGDTAQERAVRALSAPDPRQRAAAAQTLGALHVPGSAEALAARFRDPDGSVRVVALQALAKLADPAVLPALRAELTYPDPAFRAALAETLGAYRDPALLPELIQLLNDTDGRVRAEAATALGLLGDGRAVEELLAHRGDADPRTQAAVAGALRRLGDAPEGGVRRQSLPPRLGAGNSRSEAAD